MDKEKGISDQIKKYQDLAKDDKSIDIASLALSGLQGPGNLVSPKSKTRAYIVSLLFPPIGILIAVYYFFRDEQDSNTVAWISLALTGTVLLLFWISFKALLSGSGVSLDQIEQIDPEEIRQLLR